MKSKIKIILVNTAVLISFIILVTLGTWQLDRKEQKEQLFEKIKRVNLVVGRF
jgi:cytochrome oxidase assembly protein ShyY1